MLTVNVHIYHVYMYFIAKSTLGVCKHPVGTVEFAFVVGVLAANPAAKGDNPIVAGAYLCYRRNLAQLGSAL